MSNEGLTSDMKAWAVSVGVAPQSFDVSVAAATSGGR
jgi:hypothetical protein